MLDGASTEFDRFICVYLSTIMDFMYINDIFTTLGLLTMQLIGLVYL